MKKLRVLDARNYTNDLPLLERVASRAVIAVNGQLALTVSGKGEHKLPGGTLEAGESPTELLIREVREETGLVVIPESIVPIGEIDEFRRDAYDENQRYHCLSLYYWCEVLPEALEPCMTQTEILKGFHPLWATPEQALESNRRLREAPWMEREICFFEMLASGEVPLHAPASRPV